MDDLNDMKGAAGGEKTSSEILNELFSAFNSVFDEDGSGKKHKKSKKSKKKKSKDKDKKRKSKSPSPSDLGSVSSKKSPKKKKRKLPTGDNDGNGTGIGIGIVPLEFLLEDGEIAESSTLVNNNEKLDETGGSKKHKKKSKSPIKMKKSKHKKSSTSTSTCKELFSEKVDYDHDHEQALPLTPPPSSLSKIRIAPSKDDPVFLTEKINRKIDKIDRRHSLLKSNHHHKRSRSRSPRPSSRDNREREYRDVEIRRVPPSTPPRYERHEHEPPSVHMSRSREEYSKWQKGRDYSPGSGPSSSIRRNYSPQNQNHWSYYGGHRSGFGSSQDKRYRGRSRSYSRSRSRSPRGRSRSRSRSPRRYKDRRSRRHGDDVIDKAKLLEIARKNASKLLRNGVMPTDIFSRDQIVAIRAGGKSVEELTDYCRKIARKDARGEGGHFSSGDEELINHPFIVTDRPMPQITLNIRNAIPLPVRSAHELALEGAKLKVQFPVSSGTQHRVKEIEWHPVVPEEDKKEKEKNSKALAVVEGPKVNKVAPMIQGSTAEVVDVADIPIPPTQNEQLAILDTNQHINESDSQAYQGLNRPITYDDPKLNVDISSVISQRLRAMRKLQENPENNDAKQQLDTATYEMKNWAEAKALVPKFLSQADLTRGPQAWAKKDQLKRANKIDGGMGMYLLQRLGWKPGEGLGKNKEGETEPLALEIKTDKKGLTATEDIKKMHGGPPLSMIYDLSGKNPISALMELTNKRHWGAPIFEICFEHGPPHKKQFVYKVTVNGIEYQPSVAVNNKKQAKTTAAAFCLQSLGLLNTKTPKAKDAASNEVKMVSAPTLLQTVMPTPEDKPQPIQTQTASASAIASNSKFSLHPPLPIEKFEMKPPLPPAPAPVPAPVPAPKIEYLKNPIYSMSMPPPLPPFK